MSFKRFVVLVLVFVLAVGVFAPVTAQEKTITITFTQEADTLLNPYTTMTFSGYIQGLFLDGAWSFDGDLNPVPQLVTEIPTQENGGINEDGSVITLRLREGLLWSDGDPLTSADFVFTYEMYIAEGNAVNSRDPYDKMVSVEAPDDLTVVVTFPEPYAPWLGSIFTRVLPEHVLRPVFEAEGTLDNAEFGRNPSVASGPFMLETWDYGNFMRFVRNPNYYGSAPLLDAVIVNFIPDDQAYLAAHTSGNSDIGTFFPLDQVPALEDSGLFNIGVYASGYNEGWYLNINPATGHPALQDVRVRQAVALAFDELAVTEDLLFGATYPPSGIWEGTPYDNPNLPAYAYDPEQAIALLDQAGWIDSNGDGTRDKDGVELVLRYATTTRQIRVDTQVVAQQQLAEVGIGVELINHPSDVFFNSYGAGGPMASGQFDIGQWSTTTAFPDPDSVRFLCAEIPSDANPTGSNWSGYCDPETDALFVEQARTVDTAARVALFHQIDQRLYDAYVWLGIWYDADVWISNMRITNVQFNGATPFWNIYAWDVTN